MISPLRYRCLSIGSSYPFDIPLNTSVPSWAYIDPDTTGGAFNQTVAQQFISKLFLQSVGLVLNRPLDLCNRPART
jgi:hypothetical protein